MRFLVFLLLLPFACFSETLNVALYENHDNYIKHSRAYKVNWELLKLAANNEGLILRTQPYLWVRALDALKKNRVDAVIGAYYSEERSEIGHFSPPFALDGIYLYAKKQNSLSLNEIISSRALVGVTTSSIGDSLAKKLKFIDIYRKSSSEQVFELLIKGKLDYAIFSDSVARTHCEMKEKSKLNENCLFAITPLMTTNAFHTIYSNAAMKKNISKRLELATKRLITEGKIKPIFINSGYNEEEYKTWLKTRKNWFHRFM
jgi:ABC-type amino acid transport substrate-binding protein